MHGYLLVDKPAGPTSFAALRDVRRQLGKPKIGHAGTLDPFATGLLVVLVGDATRLMQWVVGHRKRYLLHVQLGATSDTDDSTGTLTPVADSSAVTEEQLAVAIQELSSVREQAPPRVSALHIDGERAYKRARRGESFDVGIRPVEFHAIHIVGYDASSGVVGLDVTASSGAYMRSLARDTGERVGCGGHALALRRLEVGSFRVDDALEPHSITADAVRPMGELVAHLPQCTLDATQVVDFAHGRRVEADLPDRAAALAVLDASGELLGIGSTEGEAGVLRPRAVLASAREMTAL